MVRVLFVAGSFKHAFVLKMIQHFSQEVESKVIIPSYPRTSRTRRREVGFRKASEILFGGKQATDALATFKPDLIYTDNPLYGSQSKVSQYVLRRPVPTLVHLRGDLWRESLEWISRSNIRPRFPGSSVYLYGILGLVLADKIVPICRWLQAEVLKHLPWKSTEVVYQGVDPSEFFHRPGPDLAHPCVAIIQNHTVYQKTLGLLRFGKVIEKLPDVHFYVATGQDIKQTYLPLVRENLSHMKNVHFLQDILHPDDVRRFLSSSDVYVLPSYLDCCPTTVLEASLMEKPVLASRVGGIPEIVRDEYTGWTICNEDIDEWVNRTRILIDDPDLSRRLGAQGRKWVSENFGWPRIASQVERLLKEFVKTRSPVHRPTA